MSWMPQPEVTELPFEDGWRQWDMVVKLQDNPKETHDHE